MRIARALLRIHQLIQSDLALALDASELVVEKLSKEQRAVNALARWRLGPFSITQLDSVTEWLDKGIALVLINVFDGTMPLEITPEALEAFAGAASQLPRAPLVSASQDTFDVQFAADGSSTELNMSSMGTITPSSAASSVLALVLSSAAAMAEPERQAVGKQREE